MSSLMDNIKSLRELTGAGFLDCKKALQGNNNEIDKSIDFLRKKGLAKAVEKSSREAKEGAVGVFMNDKVAVILEINTETDFAAKNEIFLDFVDEIGRYALNVNCLDPLAKGIWRAVTRLPLSVTSRGLLGETVVRSPPEDAPPGW